MGIHGTISCCIINYQIPISPVIPTSMFSLLSSHDQTHSCFLHCKTVLCSSHCFPLFLLTQTPLGAEHLSLKAPQQHPSSTSAGNGSAPSSSENLGAGNSASSPVLWLRMDLALRNILGLDSSHILYPSAVVSEGNPRFTRRMGWWSQHLGMFLSVDTGNASCGTESCLHFTA